MVDLSGGCEKRGFEFSCRGRFLCAVLYVCFLISAARRTGLDKGRNEKTGKGRHNQKESNV
jgi:hypothetical protein